MLHCLGFIISIAINTFWLPDESASIMENEKNAGAIVGRLRMPKSDYETCISYILSAIMNIIVNMDLYIYTALSLDQL